MDSYSTYDSYSTSSSSDAAAAGVILVVYLLIFIFAMIPLLITTWKMFTKAGKPGFAAIVPIYSTVVMGQIGRSAIWLIALSFFVPILPLILLYNFAVQYKASAGFWVCFILFPIATPFMVGGVEYHGQGKGIGQDESAAAPAAYGPVAPAAPMQPMMQQQAPMQPAAPAAQAPAPQQPVYPQQPQPPFPPQQ